jgi:hypothetical protein
MAQAATNHNSRMAEANTLAGVILWHKRGKRDEATQCFAAALNAAPHNSLAAWHATP